MSNANKIFAISKGDVISFVGAGGKTSLINSLAVSIRRHFSIAITTTTHMYPVSDKRFQNHLFNNDNSLTTLNNLKDGNRIPVFFSSLDSESKGLPPASKDFQNITALFDVVLIEADGARGKLLKFPRPHEPVVPDFSKKVVLVVGLDILGKKISDNLVFHPELFKDKGWNPETIVTWQILRDVLYSPDSYLDKLQGKDIFLALNKSDSIDELTKQYARLMYHENIKSIILSSTKSDKLKLEQVDNSEIPLVGILLAAGQSVRYGSPKLTDTFQSKPLFLHSLKSSNESNLDKLIVVTGEMNNELMKLSHKIPNSRAEFVRNPTPSKGISSSIKIALNKIIQKYPGSAVMIMLADMPCITSDLINKVLEAFRNSATPITAPFIDGPPERPDLPGRAGRNAHPVIFHPLMFPELLKLEGDHGGKEIIMSHLDMVKKIKLTSPSSQLDIDTVLDSKGVNYHDKIL